MGQPVASVNPRCKVVNVNCQDKRLKYEHLLGKEEDTLKRSTSSISGEVMPTNRLPVVFERSTVEI